MPDHAVRVHYSTGDDTMLRHYCTVRMQRSNNAIPLPRYFADTHLAPIEDVKRTRRDKSPRVDTTTVSTTVVLRSI